MAKQKIVTFHVGGKEHDVDVGQYSVGVQALLDMDAKHESLPLLDPNEVGSDALELSGSSPGTC